MKIYQNLKDVTEARHFLGGKNVSRKSSRKRFNLKNLGKEEKIKSDFFLKCKEENKKVKSKK